MTITDTNLIYKYLFNNTLKSSLGIPLLKLIKNDSVVVNGVCISSTPHRTKYSQASFFTV
jgi:hypothetical protein